MMTRQVAIESPAATVVNRTHPLLNSKGEKQGKQDNQKRRRIGGVAGSATAECAAVCCCCPCGVIHLLILAVYKIPTGIFKKAWKKKKRKRLLKNQKEEQEETQKPENKKSDESDGGGGGIDSGLTVAVDFENEMGDRFYGTGFWRSPSDIEE